MSSQDANFVTGFRVEIRVKKGENPLVRLTIESTPFEHLLKMRPTALQEHKLLLNHSDALQLGEILQSSARIAESEEKNLS